MSTSPSSFFVPAARRRWINSPDVSRGELLLFRLIERLSVGRAGCVLNFAKLAEMLGKCERQAWTLFGRLVKAGWVAYKTYRKAGKSYFEFWPVVRVAERSQPIFERSPRIVKEASEGSFLGSKTAPMAALSTPKNCTLVEGAYKTLLTPKGGGQQTTEVPTSATDGMKNETLTESQTDSVAVSLFQKEVSTHEAQELAREATKRQLTKEQIERVLDAYRSQQEKIRNRGAWLREAIRRGFTPALQAPTHSSEVSRAPVAKRAKADFAPRTNTVPLPQGAFEGGQCGRAGMRANMEMLRKGLRS